MKSFSENLRHARTERGLSQEQLAKLIGVKSGSVIYNWESCTARPDIDKIFKICEVLQISANYLFNTSDDYPSTEEMNVIKNKSGMMCEYLSIDLLYIKLMNLT